MLKLSRRAVLLGSVALAGEAQAKGKPADLAAKALGVPMTQPPPADEAMKTEAVRVGREVVCLCGTCPKRLIADCECGWAVQNQHAIVHALQAGKSDAEIIGAYRKVYGDQVLAMLPNEGLAVTAWALPYAGAVAGLLAAFYVGMRYIKRDESPEAAAPSPVAAPTSSDADRATLARELEDLD